MRIAIFGSGGVGGFFGARLAQAGQQVIFIARGANLAAMRNHGLQVESIDGDFVLDTVEATDDPGEVGKVDYIICGVKAWQVRVAAQTMLPMVGENTLVISLQNGVEAPAQLAETLGQDKVLGGLCKVIVFREGAGRIKHIGAKPLIQFGHLDNHADPRVDSLAQIFDRCHQVKSSIPENIQVALWQKFMLICSWSGVGAVTRAPVGLLLKQSGTRDMMIAAMQEIITLAQAKNIDLPNNSAEINIAGLAQLAPASTTSMQRDIAGGMPSELDYQTGAVVRLAEEVAVDTPVNRFILDSLSLLEQKARGRLEF